MRKCICFFLPMLIFLSQQVSAASNGGVVFYVDGFYQDSRAVRYNLRQYSTRYNNSCGPTSVAFIENHLRGGNQTFASSVIRAQSKIRDMYSNIPVGTNRVTDFSRSQLRTLIDDIPWYKSFRRAASSGVSRNMDFLMGDLTANRPALIVLDSGWPGNPTYGTHNIDHIVVVYAYQKRRDEYGNSANSSRNTRNNDRIYFFDPYYGGSGSFKRSETNSVVNLAGFAYLMVMRDNRR